MTINEAGIESRETPGLHSAVSLTLVREQRYKKKKKSIIIIIVVVTHERPFFLRAYRTLELKMWLEYAACWRLVQISTNRHLERTEQKLVL